jgi:hypothetical protein
MNLQGKSQNTIYSGNLIKADTHYMLKYYQAERDLRMIKAKSKISGCFRGENGGVVFASIKSYTSTLRKNSKNIFEPIRLAFAGMPVIC